MRYSPKQYASVLHEILQRQHGEQFSKSVKNFLFLLKKSNQTKLLPKIFKELERLEEGKAVTITSAAALPHGAVRHVQEIFSTEKMQQRTAKELLGGAVIEWDDWRVDGSVRGRLQQLRSVMS